MKNDSLNNWYKDSFESLSEVPAPEAWDNIAEALDAAKPAAGGGFKKIYWVSALAFLIGMGSMYLINEALQEDPVVQQMAEANIATPIPSNDGPAVEAIAPVNNNASIPTNNAVEMPVESNDTEPGLNNNAQQRNANAVAQQQATLATHPTANTGRVASSAQHSTSVKPTNNNTTQPTGASIPVLVNALTTIEEEDVDLFVTNTADVEENGLANTTEEEEKETLERLTMQAMPAMVWESNSPELLTPRDIPGGSKMIPFEQQGMPLGFYAGVTATYNKVWALNYDTYKAADPNTSTQNINRYGLDYGLSFGYNLSDKAAIQSDVLIDRSRGQIIENTMEGATTRHEMTLNYSQINLLYKKKLPKLVARNASSFNIMAGPYAGYLKQATRLDDGVSSDVKDHYTTFDFGAELGLEYEVYVQRKLGISFGARSAISGNNIFAGTQKIPRDFNTTRNLSLGANFGLKYMLSSQK